MPSHGPNPVAAEAGPRSATREPRSWSGRRPFIWLLIAATLLTLSAWSVVVPPFEGPDESAFYQGLMNYASGGTRFGWPLYAIAMKPALKLAGGQDRAFQARYNPSFRFVSNLPGRVNVFMHGRTEGTLKGDVNRMYLLRLLTLFIWTVSLLLIFETARLFFGRADLALLTAVVGLSIPQLSFFASKIHPEALATLLASLAYFALTARVYGRIGRVPTWIVALAVLTLAPFSDRQAYFLILLVPVGLIAAETTKLGAAIALAVLLVPAVLLFNLPQFIDLQRDIGITVLGPFRSWYHGGWWNQDNPQYLAFEFAPKLFFGFCGWLGQPSILLPPAVYASMAVMIALAIAGFFRKNGRQPLTREQRRIVWLFAAGVFVTAAPIIYANILISRNSWHGRWLFPSLAPIMIGLVVGFRSFAVTARRRPHLVAGALLGISTLLAIAWAGDIGDAVRAGIHANHYGDQAHVIKTIRDFIAALAVAAILVEAAAFALRRAQVTDGRTGPVMIAAGAWGLNLLLLFSFVAPLYQPLDAEGLAAAIRGEVAEGEYGRASALYRIGLTAYPSSTALRRVGTDTPMVVLSGGDDQLLADLQARIGRGQKLETRLDLMALARVVRTKGWLEPAALRQVAEQSEAVPELAEPLGLIHAQLEGRTRDASVGAAVIRAGNGVVIRAEMHGDALLEGYTVHLQPTGYNEVVVYFRPMRGWSPRRLWIHAYPAGKDYVAIDPVQPTFGGWNVGELSWEVFQVPANARYNCYLGVAIGDELGQGYPLGWIGG